MFPPQAPWTGLGQLEGEINRVKNDLSRKADSCEVYSLKSRVDSLEHSIGEIRSTLDGISSRLYQVEESQMNRAAGY